MANPYPHTEETKRKISATLTGRKNGPRPQWVKDKIAATKTGSKHTTATRRRMSESQRLRYERQAAEFI